MSYQLSTCDAATQTHQPNPELIKIEDDDDSDDNELVPDEAVPEFRHLPKDYDPKCHCKTCERVKKLAAECGYKVCRGEELLQSADNNQVNQVDEEPPKVILSIANVYMNEVKRLPSSRCSDSLINNAPTSEHASDSDDDNELVPDEVVPEFRHLPKDYDPKCHCKTCERVKILAAECGCKVCRGEGEEVPQSADNNQVNQVDDEPPKVILSIANVYMNEVKRLPNSRCSDSLINNAPTSEHASDSDDDNDDDGRSGSSTPEYAPRFFNDDGDESKNGELGSNEEVEVGDSVHDDNSRSSTPDYAPRFFDDEDEESESGESSSGEEVEVDGDSVNFVLFNHRNID